MRPITMAPESSPVDHIKANAALVATMAHDLLGTDTKFDEAAVRWLDGFIQRQHERGKPELHEGLMNTLGSFLGECVIRTYGGAWAHLDGSWGVQFDERNAVFPFAKVLEQLQDGAGDSVLSFFTVIPLVFKGTTPHM
jgi:hypothetical protein